MKLSFSTHKSILRMVFCVFFTTFLFTGHTTFAQSDKDVDISEIDHTEKIIQYDVDFELLADDSAHVTETIVYDFGDNEKHGIFRVIPTSFKSHGQYWPMKYEIESVTDETGYDYLNNVSKSIGFLGLPGAKDEITIKIGDPDVLVKGVKTYIIKYKVSHVVGFFDAYDEVYFNLLGVNWQVPVVTFNARISLPPGVTLDMQSISFYCGEFQETNLCGTFEVIEDKEILFSASAIQEFSGVTTGFSFTKGMIPSPDKKDFWKYVIVQYWVFLLPFLLPIILRLSRIKNYLRVRKYNINHPLTVEYSRPLFSPLQARFVLKTTNSLNDFATVLVDLAVRGHIVILEKDSKYTFLVAKNSPADTLSQTEKTIVDFIGEMESKDISGSSDELLNSVSEIDTLSTKEFLTGSFDKKISKLVEKKEFTASFAIKTINTLQNEIKDIIFEPSTKFTWVTKIVGSNKELNYISSVTQSLIPGLFLLVITGIFFSGYVVPFVIFLTCMTVGVSNAIGMSYRFPMTENGLRIRREIEGLKYYIKIAEKDRINFANAPAKTPALFEKLLPYAMAFGLEKKWIKEFELIVVSSPVWFKSESKELFSIVTFKNNISSFVKQNTLSTGSVRSGSSGFSGSSGRGHSGGGGGGGGGGSW